MIGPIGWEEFDDRQTDRQTDRRQTTGRQTDRQTENSNPSVPYDQGRIYLLVGPRLGQTSSVGPPSPNFYKKFSFNYLYIV